MVQVQYIVDGHTAVYIDKSREKTKVVSGEIIEVSPALAKTLQYRGFKILEGIEVKSEEDGKDDITIEIKKKKK